MGGRTLIVGVWMPINPFQFLRVVNTRYSTLLSRSYSFSLGFFWYVLLLLFVSSLSLGEKFSRRSLWIAGYGHCALLDNDSIKASSVLSRVITSCVLFLSCRRCGLFLHSICCYNYCTLFHTQCCSSSNHLSLLMCIRKSIFMEILSLVSVIQYGSWSREWKRSIFRN